MYGVRLAHPHARAPTQAEFELGAYRAAAFTAVSGLERAPTDARLQRRFRGGVSFMRSDRYFHATARTDMGGRQVYMTRTEEAAAAAENQEKASRVLKVRH